MTGWFCEAKPSRGFPRNGVNNLKVGIYGGTFNPPHIGHLRSAQAAIRQLGLDLLIIVPCGVPSHKPLPQDTPPADIRMKMAALTFESVERTEISDIETKNPTPSYTVDTAAKIKENYPDAEIFLLVGTDMFLTLDDWKDSKTLLKTISPAVFSRGQDDAALIAGKSDFLQKSYGVKSEIVYNNVIEISSSELRKMLQNRRGCEYFTEETYAYIIKKRLYNAKPDWNRLRSRAHSMLKPERIPHVVGCEEEALRLAKRWGVDPDEAREAAILHDITKKALPHENLAIIEKYGTKGMVPNRISDYKKGEEKLLHSKTAALIALNEFGVSQTVAEAIDCHTTGKRGMSKLDKIIYLADYIEPTRDFDGVDILRVLSYENLNEAVKMGIELTVKDLTERGIPPCQTSLGALDEL